MNRKRLAYPYSVWSVIFVVVPLLLILFLAFTAKDADGYHFTLQHFARFFSDATYISVIWRSIYLSLIATAICLLIAYPLAMILASKDFIRKGFLITLVVLPMWMNFLLRTYAWMALLQNKGLINSLLTHLGLQPMEFLYHEYSLVLGMVYNFLPFMILPIYSVLIKIDRSAVEAAEDLGANAFQVFFRVTLPLSLGGVMSGITMVFMPAVTTFAISQLLGGGKIFLIGNLIENEFLLSNNWNFGSALSCVLLVLILISTVLMNRFGDEEDGGLGLW